MPLLYKLEDPARPWAVPSFPEWLDFFLRHGETEEMARRSWEKHREERWHNPNTGKWYKLPEQAYTDIERIRKYRLAQEQRSHSADLAQRSPIPAAQPLYHNTASAPHIPPSAVAVILDIIARPHMYAYNVRVKAVLTIQLYPPFFDLATQASAVELRHTLQQNPAEYAKLIKTLTPIVHAQFGGQAS